MASTAAVFKHALERLQADALAGADAEANVQSAAGFNSNFMWNSNNGGGQARLQQAGVLMDTVTAETAQSGQQLEIQGAGPGGHLEADDANRGDYPTGQSNCLVAVVENRAKEVGLASFDFSTLTLTLTQLIEPSRKGHGL